MPILGIFSPKTILMFRVGLKKIRVSRPTGTTHTFHLSLIGIPFVCLVDSLRVPTVREKSAKNEKKFKVREQSGNFELSQGNLKFWKKSGKSQGI